jgi:hypothetical protein
VQESAEAKAECFYSGSLGAVNYLRDDGLTKLLGWPGIGCSGARSRRWRRLLWESEADLFGMRRKPRTRRADGQYATYWHGIPDRGGHRDLSLLLSISVIKIETVPQLPSKAPFSKVS